jgi:hypothetical protein
VQHGVFKMYGIGHDYHSSAGVSYVSSLARAGADSIAAIIVIYVDSLVFIMGASIISHGFDMESSKDLCSQAILLCLACYMTTKVRILSGT